MELPYMAYWAQIKAVHKQIMFFASIDPVGNSDIQTVRANEFILRTE